MGAANFQALLRRRLFKRRTAARLARVLLDLSAARSGRPASGQRERIFIGAARS